MHRLAYSFGWETDEEVPPGSSLIEIDLIEQDGGTLLRMTHSGLPSAALRDAHAKGWAHYLGRLTKAAAGPRIPVPIGGQAARATRRDALALSPGNFIKVAPPRPGSDNLHPGCGEICPAKRQTLVRKATPEKSHSFTPSCFCVLSPEYPRPLSSSI